MKLRDFFNNKEYRSLLEKYTHLDDNNGDWFAKSLDDLQAKECVLPVLGVQGSGKSSFLNSLLFGDIVLPVDAAETTCIPTVVKYGTNKEPKACVVFKNGEQKPIACTEDGLGEYAHQDKNPGNKLGISHIEIQWNNDLLSNGITLVDLPGVGSITAENQRTTLEFLKKSTGAIFMLRTTPTITKSEATFIRGALPLMGRVFWVQNQWTDDAPNDLQESKDYNYGILKQIAKELRQPEDIIVEPDVVCVKRALDGRILGKNDMVEKSGIHQLRDKLVHFNGTWQDSIKQGKLCQAKEFVASALNAAQEKLQLLSGDVDEEMRKIRKLKSEAEENLEFNRKQSRQALDYLDEREAQLKTIVHQQCQLFTENLRNDVREVIDNGVVGGQQLNQAFQDHLDNRANELSQAVQPEFLQTMEELGRNLGEMKDCRFNAEKINEQANFSNKTKIHDHYGRLGAVGGTIAGAALGSIIPGVGNVVGGLIGGLVGGLLGIFSGNKAKKIHVDLQKEAAKKELFAYIKEVQEKAEKTYKDCLERFKSDVDAAIKQWLRNQENQIDEDYRVAKKDLEKPVEEKEKEKHMVSQDIEVLTALSNTLEA